MAEVYSIVCDHCGNDLTHTSNSNDWYLVLRNRMMTPKGGFVTDVLMTPPLEADAAFCGMNCLAGWVNGKFASYRKPLDTDS